MNGEKKICATSRFWDRLAVWEAVGSGHDGPDDVLVVDGDVKLIFEESLEIDMLLVRDEHPWPVDDMTVCGNSLHPTHISFRVFVCACVCVVVVCAHAEKRSKNQTTQHKISFFLTAIVQGVCSYESFI